MTPDKERRWARAWDYHKQLDSLLGARINFSLVAQAMLVAAFATLFAADQTHDVKIVESLICVLAIVFAFTQGWMSYSITAKILKLKNDHLEPLDKMFKNYRKIRFPLPAYFLTIAIPLPLGAFWVLCWYLAAR